MKKSDLVKAVDLFCGAGGSSSGLKQACEDAGLRLDLVAINHWDVAIATHSKNHPDSKHLHSDLETVNPRTVIPSGRLDLLLASPECTHHSNARGGKPVSDQKRAQPWLILRWAEALYIETLIIENVREFRQWGPIGANGRPLKSKRGALYQQFLASLRALGYKVEDRILCAAKYGDPTTRERLFIVARRGNKGIAWPEPTHSAPDGARSLFKETKPYRTAREIIDWSLPGESIFNRKRPLADNTLRRIFAGLAKYSGIPFIVPQFSESNPRSVDEPLPTIVTTSRGIGLAIPSFIVPQFGERNGQHPRTHSIDEPLPAVTGHGAGALVQPYLVILRNHGDGASVNSPLPTITASGTHLGVAEPKLTPFTVGTGGPEYQGPARSVDEPLRTILTRNHQGICQPIIVALNHGKDANRSYPLDKPFPVITSVDAWGIAQPYLVKSYTGSDSCSLDEPLPTITAEYEHLGLAQPFLVKYNGTAGARSVDEPLDTISTHDRFGLCIPQLGAVLDILFRMLQPHELAAGMSFPKTYVFTGTREDKVKQIGNAVAVQTARALCLAYLETRPKPKRRKKAA